MITQEVHDLAQKLWDYHHMNQKIKKSDCILVLGSHDTRVAERGAELYLKKFAPILVYSGGLGKLTDGVWTETEADKFAKIAINMGVPTKDILIENKSTNTGENIIFSKQLLAEKGFNPQSFTVVQKPYMERRSYATFKKHWPDKDIISTSPQVSFDDYPNDEIPVELVINLMVGNLDRIKVYPEMGFQIPQEIPDDIIKVFERLKELGYDKNIIK